MYYPIQIPYILNQDFLHSIQYSETLVPELSDFVLCFWQMLPKLDDCEKIKNIIVADGCIDLVVNFESKVIGFAGMKHTNFEFVINSHIKYLGARLMPGAFYQLTGIPANEAMDNFLPLEFIDKSFDLDYFFSLSFEKSKQVFIEYLHQIVSEKQPDEFTKLFNRLSENAPESVSGLFDNLGITQRQCQRIFAKHFGLSPKMILSILRFQKCLTLLTSEEVTPSAILNTAHFYDQAHFINDFKRNIGITPFDLIDKYKRCRVFPIQKN